MKCNAVTTQVPKLEEIGASGRIFVEINGGAFRHHCGVQ
jgi:hypothetical protein|tara:strand:- start:1237 stop:1353 length:117 start_codon:yes stop_codon:yes gene_type:complete